MIISKFFDDDDNALLKGIQHDSYGHSLDLLYRVAKEQYIIADLILQTNHPNISLLTEVKAFDHRTLQDTHDTLAAVFRYRNQNLEQLELFDRAGDESSRYLRLWSDWLRSELSSLKSESAFIRNIVEAVIYSNKDKGYAAEDRLQRFLFSYYEVNEWSCKQRLCNK